jgi:outer membrane protein assembly factor BamA
MLSASLGFGQTPAARKKAAPKPAESTVPTKWPVQSVVVEGNHNYTREQVIAVAGLKIGQVAGKEEFEAARDRLVATGAFETVGYKFEPSANQQGYVATFQVVEVEPAYPVRFEGFSVPAAELAGVLSSVDPLFSTAKLPATKVVLDRHVGWLQEYMATKGSTEKLMARLNPVGTDQFEVVFRPARNLPSVAQVTFDGNKGVPQYVLRDAVGGVAVGQIYTEEHFRELLNTGVRPTYEARGYIRVKFGTIRTEPAKDVQGLHVFVAVDEGAVYQLSKVTIAGPTPLRPESLIKAAEIKTDEVANFDKVAEGLEKIRKAVVRSGFLDAKVTPERMIDDEKKTVEVAVHVDAGPQFMMGKLTIVGLDLDGEAEMRRIWATKEGKPFNPEYPDVFLNNIRQQGLFDNLGDTKAAVKRNDQDHVADVTLTFGFKAPPDKRRRGRFGEELPPNP